MALFTTESERKRIAAAKVDADAQAAAERAQAAAQAKAATITQLSEGIAKLKALTPQTPEIEIDVAKLETLLAAAEL